MYIIYDAMGGDKAPEEIIKGALDSINEFEIKAVLIGDSEIIKKELDKYNYNEDSISIVNASEVIGNEDDPVMSIRKKKDSSIVKGIKMLEDSRYAGIISAGSTGALLAGGIFISKKIAGLDRAVLPVNIPTIGGMVTVMDSGANMDCSPELLQQFALMGSVYAKNILNIENPRVALLNVGSEKGKGNDIVKKAYSLLEDLDINFVGNIEARDIMFGKADVVICDGFVGNVFLKTSEGVAVYLMGMLKKSIENCNLPDETKLAIFKILKTIAKDLDYSEYGGTPLLGLQKAIIKAHGSSDAKAIKNATKQLIDYIEKDTIKVLGNKLGDKNER